ncbi:MAG TPA: sulfatase [Myxococcota bacterium]|nr:sulfatase [Myxococcota bacterium]
MRRSSRRSAAWLWLAVSLLACSDSAAPRAAADAPLQGAVLVVLDTVRADHCSAYGYARPTTPSLERLAQRGVLFENAISSAPWTLPAVASLLAGDGAAHALDGGNGSLRRSLVEILHRAGIATAAFTEGGFVSRDFLFDRGFDAWIEEEGNVRRAPVGTEHRPGRGSAARTFERATAWLARQRDGRFFLLVHTYEPHTPYTDRRFAAELPEGRLGADLRMGMVRDIQRGEIRLEPQELRYIEALYDGDIRAADDALGRLLDALEAQGLAERTLVVVTSDHGEDLGDLDPQRAASHGHALKDPLVRVPLVIADPTDPRPGRRVAAQVRLVDVLPTIAARLGAPHALEIEGRDLGPLLRGEDAEPRVAFGGDTRIGPARRFVRTQAHKYIEAHGDGSARELFDLAADPREQRDVAAEQPEVAEALSRMLAERSGAEPARAAAPALDALPAPLQERLRALGYAD